MIVTVTPNPALDLTYAVDAVVAHRTHRVSAVTERAGGKGLNVARVLHALGEPVLATGLLGGATGGRVAELLAEDGVPASFVTVTGETRRTVAVVDGRDATGFWEPGPTVTAAEWARFVEHFRSLLPRASVVTLCGSLPRGVPLDGYAGLIAIAAASGVPTVLDSSGVPLRLGLDAGPTVAKPNVAELEDLLGAAGRDGRAGAAETNSESGAAGRNGQPGLAELNGRIGAGSVDVAALVRKIRDVTGTAVVVSRGAAGLLMVGSDGVLECVPPTVVSGNPTGAGDACVAALARGLRRGTPWPELLGDAVALSAAAVVAPVAGAFDIAAYQRLATRMSSPAPPAREEPTPTPDQVLSPAIPPSATPPPDASGPTAPLSVRSLPC